MFGEVFVERRVVGLRMSQELQEPSPGRLGNFYFSLGDLQRSLDFFAVLVLERGGRNLRHAIELRRRFPFPRRKEIERQPRLREREQGGEECQKSEIELVRKHREQSRAQRSLASYYRLPLPKAKVA